jgi:hypothetical protein
MKAEGLATEGSLYDRNETTNKTDVLAASRRNKTKNETDVRAASRRNKTEDKTDLDRRWEKDYRIESHQSGSLKTLASGSETLLGII